MTRYLASRPEQSSQSRKAAASTRGVTLVELLFVVAVASIVTVSSIPVISTTMTNLHLGSSATSLASALQSARFRAISTGCQVQVAVSAQTYQVSGIQISGTPPSCVSTYSNWCAGVYSTAACPVPYTTSEISTTSATTVASTGTVTTELLPLIVQFNPSGTITTSTTTPATTPPNSFTFTLAKASGSSTTKTVNVSGAGYVKITVP